MSMPGVAYPRRDGQIVVRLRDYLELTKPKIAVLVLATVAAVAYHAGCDGATVFHTVVGVGLVAASGSAMNQWLERESDRQMDRTRLRPLPARRLGTREVLAFAAGTLGAGFVTLLVNVNLLTAALGLVTWILYVVVYTPMKTRTAANTWVGAVAGAMPVLMGYAAAGRPIGLLAASIFLVLFLWQFPHFMAIAWIYRHQYSAAGIRMLTVVDGSGLRAGALAVTASLAIVPISLVPTILPLAGSPWTYAIGASLLGIGQIGCAARFLIRRDDASARHLLLASLVYLTALLFLLILAHPTR